MWNSDNHVISVANLAREVGRGRDNEIVLMQARAGNSLAAAGRPTAGHLPVAGHSRRRRCRSLSGGYAPDSQR